MIAFVYTRTFFNTKNYYIKTNRKAEPLVQDKYG